MDYHAGETTLSALHDILQATALPEAQRIVGNLIEGLGFGGYGFGLVWGSSAVTEGSAMLVDGNLERVVPAYFERGLVNVDPVARALGTARAPVLWDLAPQSAGDGIEESGRRRVRELMHQFGIFAGVSIPVDIAAVNCRAALSVAAPTGMQPIDFDLLYLRHGRTLHLAALAIASALGTAMVRPRDVSLSNNERQVLEALCDGLRPREIARRLSKSEHTVRNQIASAQQRLGARTKEQALITAARLGLIDL